MAPRKRQRPNPVAEASSASLPTLSSPPTMSSRASAVSSRPSAAAAVAGPSSNPEAAASLPNLSLPRQAPKNGSWNGSWPRAPKSSASTQLARETIFGGTLRPSSTSDLHRFDALTRRGGDNASLYAPSESAATLPNIPESTTSAVPNDGAETKMALDEPPKPVQGDTDMKDVPEDKPQENAVGTEVKNTPETPQRPATSSGWKGWFAWSPASGAAVPPSIPTSTPLQASPTPSEPQQAPQDLAQQDPTPATTTTTNTAVAEAPAAPESMAAEMTTQSVAEAPTNTPAPALEITTAQPQTAEQPRPPVATTYWFDFWSARNSPKPPGTETASTQVKDENPVEEPPKEEPPKDAPRTDPQDVVMEDAPPPETPAPLASPAPTGPPPSAGSTWAFWSRDTRRPKSASGASTPKPEAGELAVIGDGSEEHPKVATSPTLKDGPFKEPAPPTPTPSKGKATTPAIPIPEKKNKRLRPQSMDIDTESPPGPSTPTKGDVLSKTPKQSTSLQQPESAQKAESSKKPSPVKDTPASSSKPLPPNLLLPSFSSTYHMKENPSILKQIAQLLLRTQQPAAKHVFRVKESPKIRKAIAIGVHGLFPAAYLRPMIGQPTGTSLRFASLCADAIRRWCERNGCGDCEIEKVALEGEGKITDRVNNLWRLLLNWIDQIRSADLILLACHSQGVPVGVMLLAKLIDLGIITNAKIGVCAMAGVSLGPFPDYKSSMGMLMGSAAELWEFSNPESEISQRYEQSLKEALQYGVRITYIGSIDDQLVPLESAIYSPANHPYIYRAVFIDGRIHAPDFIAHLVGFALKLRNLGVTDHGLIRELSAPLAGSLYGGEGHSRIYYDDQVYDLAVSHALETTNVTQCECTMQRAAGQANSNPYHLPWIMRGLLEEGFVKTELSSETDVLLKQFDDWKPVTKALKDVKYRLEAVRSRL